MTCSCVVQTNKSQQSYPSKIWQRFAFVRSCTKPQTNTRCNRWILGMDKLFHAPLNDGWNYLYMLGLKLTHFSKMGPGWFYLPFNFTLESSCTSDQQQCFDQYANSKRIVARWHHTVVFITGLCDGVLPFMSFTHIETETKWPPFSRRHFQMHFSWMKMYEFRLKFHRSLVLGVQLTIFQHWFRWWLGTDQATSHHLNPLCWVYRRIFTSFGLSELMC